MEKATPGELDVMLTREQREIAVSADTHIDLETVQSITQQHALTRKKQSVVSNKATLGSSEGGNFADLNEDSLIPVDINHTHINEQNHRTNINENNLMWRLENASEWLLNAKNIILQEKLTQALKECIRGESLLSEELLSAEGETDIYQECVKVRYQCALFSGKIHYHLHNYEESYRIAHNIIEQKTNYQFLEPNSDEYFLRGITSLALSNQDQCKSDLRLAINLSPEESKYESILKNIEEDLGIENEILEGIELF